MRHHIGAMEPTPRSLTPVVVTVREELAAVVEAGAARSGRSPAILMVPLADESILVEAGRDGVEIVIAVRMGASAVGSLNSALSLGGHGLPAIELTTVAGRPVISAPTLEMLSDPSLRGVNVPVPAIDEGDSRRALWAGLRAERIEERHHLVEVDGRPALDEIAARGLTVAGDELQLLAAGAAGVLAGRMAALSRRWRARD
jgi:hypothetical protein